MNFMASVYVLLHTGCLHVNVPNTCQFTCTSIRNIHINLTQRHKDLHTDKENSAVAAGDAESGAASTTHKQLPVFTRKVQNKSA